MLVLMRLTRKAGASMGPIAAFRLILLILEIARLIFDNISHCTRTDFCGVIILTQGEKTEVHNGVSSIVVECVVSMGFYRDQG